MISLDTLREHLKADDGDSDAYLLSLIDTAVDLCEARLMRSLPELEAEYGYVPPAVRHWLLVAVAELHHYRGLSTDMALNQVPFYDRMLDKYTDYSRGN
ncbi:head-tail connector protein [Parasalinivibrio latis]|uniref:head-tail connector protein n=1 Tax=Parasalinivibrio latis TaxID=2952610 RepID=UPI0030DE0BA3